MPLVPDGGGGDCMVGISGISAKCSAYIKPLVPLCTTANQMPSRKSVTWTVEPIGTVVIMLAEREGDWRNRKLAVVMNGAGGVDDGANGANGISGGGVVCGVDGLGGGSDGVD